MINRNVYRFVIIFTYLSHENKGFKYEKKIFTTHTYGRCCTYIQIVVSKDRIAKYFRLKFYKSSNNEDRKKEKTWEWKNVREKKNLEREQKGKQRKVYDDMMFWTLSSLIHSQY